MKKLVFFDIDGTLVTRNNHIPSSTIEAVEQLKLNGGIPVIATGRAHVLMREISKKLKIDSYIAMNGQYIVHKGVMIYRKPINIDVGNQVVKGANERQDCILLSTADEIVANSLISLVNSCSLYTFLKGLVGIIPERVKLKLWKSLMNKTPEKSDYENKEIYMMNINANQDEELEYEKIFAEQLTFTRANEMSMDIVNKGVSKATGAEKMISALGVHRQNTFAFGDGLNDMEIIQFVGTGVAMENGFEELKATADFVTDSVFNHGIANGLKKLELI